MSRWLSQGLSSLAQLKDHASEFANEVLSETRVEVEDPVAQLSVSKSRVVELESTLTAASNEVAFLRQQNSELSERAAAAEYQLRQLTEENSAVKEELSRVSVHSRSTDGWTISLDSPPMPVPESRGGGIVRREFSDDDASLFSPVNKEFEIRKLKDEIQQLQAECLHWKQLVKRNPDIEPSSSNSADEIARLTNEVDMLKKKLISSYEEHQNELLTLQEEHENQLAVLRENRRQSSTKSDNWDNNDENEWESWSKTSKNAIDVSTETTDEDQQFFSQNVEFHSPDESNEQKQHSVGKQEGTQRADSYNAEIGRLTEALSAKDTRIDQLECETRELSDAYNDLNEQYEKQKQESGNVVTNNRELVNRLDALKGDLVEYEEKYERCKVENEKAVKQLEMLTSEFDRLKSDLAQNRANDDPRKWQEHILRLTAELEDSLKKREELISSVGKFQEVVENFEQKVNRFRDDNQRLREENADLNETLASFGDVKRTFEDADAELSEIRRSLKEYQLEYLKKELDWRRELEEVKDENEVLKVKVAAAQAEEELGDGRLVKLSETNGNGESSYIHVEMVGDEEKAVTVNFEAQMKEVLESLNEKTEECENLRKEVEVKKGELQEREHLVQQVFAELKGLEVQLNENRNSSEIMNNVLNERNAELDRLNDEYSKLKEIVENDAKEEGELMKLWNAARAELEETRQKLTSAEQSIQRMADENQRLKADFEHFRSNISSEQQKKTAEFDGLLNRATTERDSALKELNEQTVGFSREMEMLNAEVGRLRNGEESLVRRVEELNQFLEERQMENQRLAYLLNEKDSECSTIRTESTSIARYLEEERTRSEDLRRQLNAFVEKSTHDADFQQKNDENMERWRREFQICEQNKDRALAELAAERQHSVKLVEQVNIFEDSAQRNAKEIERLRAHLMQIEDSYTNEAIKAEERETALRRRLKEVEDKLSSQLESSKDGTLQMSEQLSDMRIQLESMADQRDAALLQFADVQIELERNQKNLANLQNVLQHFQQERDSKVFGEVEKYKNEIESLKKQKFTLESTVTQMQNHIRESHEALKATNVLAEQTTAKDQQIDELKSQLATTDDRCSNLESRIVELQKVRDGKIDKDILKNLLLGYFCAPGDKKQEIAHLLGSVLGFSGEEFKKSQNSTGSGGGWLQFLRSTSSAAPSSAEQSLATQFIKFLESESVPKAGGAGAATIPLTMGAHHPTSSTATSSRSATPASAAFRLELPSFSGDESQHSSDFLKDILKSPEQSL